MNPITSLLLLFVGVMSASALDAQWVEMLEVGTWAQCSVATGNRDDELKESCTTWCKDSSGISKAYAGTCKDWHGTGYCYCQRGYQQPAIPDCEDSFIQCCKNRCVIDWQVQGYDSAMACDTGCNVIASGWL